MPQTTHFGPKKVVPVSISWSTKIAYVHHMICMGTSVVRSHRTTPTREHLSWRLRWWYRVSFTDEVWSRRLLGGLHTRNTKQVTNTHENHGRARPNRGESQARKASCRQSCSPHDADEWYPNVRKKVPGTKRASFRKPTSQGSHIESA